MAWFSALLQSLPFTNAAMLLWGLAASVPIIIHLLSKRKYQEMSWAAMEFLLAAVRKNARRLRIEQLILLLIRVAILVLLAAALADPVFSLFPTLGGALGTGSRTHYLLVIDASYSMDYRTTNKSRFELAQEWAAQVVRESQQGDGFTLLLMADPPIPLISDPAFDPEDVVDEIESLRVRHEGADLAAALAEVERILRQDRTRFARLKENRVCFFTDLGQTTWESAATRDCQERIGRIAETAMLALFDVGQSDASNLAVSSIGLDDWLVTVGREVAVEATIQNCGTQDVSGCRVLGLVNDQQVHAQSVHVPAEGRVTLRFPVAFDLPSEHQIEVRIVEDALEVDNHRWLSVPVRESVEVLCVEGRADAARYVALALEPERSSRPRIRPAVRLENALLESDLSRFDAIFLYNISRFTVDEARVLGEYVSAGGGLVVALGDLVQWENYNQRLGRGDIRVLPAQLTGLATDAGYMFDPKQYGHPIVAPFAGHERSGLLTTPIWRYIRATPYDSATAQVALSYQNGDPAIVAERIGLGTCILLTTAVSPGSMDRSTSPPTPWTALPSWPSFPPLMQEMLHHVARRGEQRNLIVGDNLQGQLAGAASDVILTVETPAGQVDRVPMEIADATSRWSYGRAAWSGIYRARFGTPLDLEERFAVNVDTRESYLARVDRDDVPSQFDPGFQVDETADVLPATRPARYFRYVLGMLLMLLLTESVLAWRFGNGSA